MHATMNIIALRLNIYFSSKKKKQSLSVFSLITYPEKVYLGQKYAFR